jgi:hypothetical protein
MWKLKELEPLHPDIFNFCSLLVTRYMESQAYLQINMDAGPVQQERRDMDLLSR